MKIDLIVARYNEDLNWLNDISYLFTRIFIYNKGKEQINLENFIEKNKIIYEDIKNVGREGQTYLYHIIKNYNDLGNKNIFTQAEPFDHIIKNKYASVDDYKLKIEKYLNSDNNFVGFGAKNYRWISGIGSKKQKLLRELHFDLFQNNFNEEYKFQNGGLFGVSKSSIMNRSLEFYKYIINFSNFNTHINPLVGFSVERMWILFFNKNYISKI